jgi:hypothetical protein
MFILSRLDSVPPESFQNQIRELVIHNVGELSSVAIAVDNPLYPLYQYGVGMEVHQYLQGWTAPAAWRFTLALDAEAPDQLLGFAPVAASPGRCSRPALAFLAVRAAIAARASPALLDDLRSRHACVELNAFASQVPWFEAMGMCGGRQWSAGADEQHRASQWRVDRAIGHCADLSDG